MNSKIAKILNKVFLEERDDGFNVNKDRLVSLLKKLRRNVKRTKGITEIDKLADILDDDAMNVSNSAVISTVELKLQDIIEYYKRQIQLLEEEAIPELHKRFLYFNEPKNY